MPIEEINTQLKEDLAEIENSCRIHRQPRPFRITGVVLYRLVEAKDNLKNGKINKIEYKQFISAWHTALKERCREMRDNEGTFLGTETWYREAYNVAYLAMDRAYTEIKKDEDKYNINPGHFENGREDVYY